MFDRFTEKADKAFSLAMKSAGEMGHNYIGSEHILLGLLKEGTGVAAKVLENAGITADQIERIIEQLVGRGEPYEVSAQDLTPRGKRIIELAYYE
ncbi:MAG: Clp protease N-terminal domain-containing protein, partial [[Clostridium] cellulosi]